MLQGEPAHGGGGGLRTFPATYGARLTPKAGTNYQPASKTSPPQDEAEQEFDDAHQSRVGNDLEQEPQGSPRV